MVPIEYKGATFFFLDLATSFFLSKFVPCRILGIMSVSKSEVSHYSDILHTVFHSMLSP